MSFRRRDAIWACTAALATAPAFAQPATIAISGVTVVDGNGGAALSDATVPIGGGRLKDVGARAAVAVPRGARAIDGAGRFLIPGMVDTNVHLSLYVGMNDLDETLVRYNPRQDEIVLEGAQIALRNGITTVRDSYGMLLP